ncbi:MAG TPA: methyltransferase domain-containing protein [Gemmatimonadota bacterium]|nr:methyltransferase domain-containing protein [Gemmatimonadota bacterium]
MPARRGPEALEWMDAGIGTDAEVAEAYRELERVNRRLAGYRATLGPLERHTVGRPASILDVAGGDGRFAERLVERLGTDREPATAWVLDLGRISNAIASRRAPAHGRVVAVRGDARHLPFPDRSLDLVHTAAFFHHLGVDDAGRVLAEMCRVSRRLVLVNDLVRSWVAAGSIWVLGHLLSRNRLVRHDGPLSVLKAFRPEELLALARAAGPEVAEFRWRLTRAFPYRMTLVGARVPKVRARWRGSPADQVDGAPT